MCPHQVGLYSPEIHNCYQHSDDAGRDHYRFNPKKWGDWCENNSYCHMVDSRAYFDCGYENKWGDNDYFCVSTGINAPPPKRGCQNPNKCCNKKTEFNYLTYYTCDNPKQEIIDGNDAAVTTLPTCPPPPCLAQGSNCNSGSNCCAPFTCYGQEYNRGQGACGGFGSADSPFNEVNQLEEINPPTLP